MTLADRVEMAGGPDRALGRQVLLFCGKGYVSPLYRWLDPTASLETAASLVPEGWDWEAASFASDGCYAGCWRHGCHDDTLIPVNDAATPALALCAASLRARYSSEQRNG